MATVDPAKLQALTEAVSGVGLQLRECTSKFPFPQNLPVPLQLAVAQDLRLLYSMLTPVTETTGMSGEPLPNTATQTSGE